MGSDLPTELWGNILQYVDDPFDVWVTCRQLSRTIRAEAERLFRNDFLPLLKLEWTYKSNKIKYFGLVAMYDKNLRDPDSTKLAFKLLAHRPVRHNARQCYTSEVERNAMVFSTLDYKDIDFQSRSEAFIASPTASLHKLRVYFDTPSHVAVYINDPDILRLRVHLIPDQFAPGQFTSDADDSPQTQNIGRISFDVRALMNDFFKEESFVRRQRALLRRPRKTRACPTQLLADADRLLVDQLVQRGIDAGAKKDDWISYEVLDALKSRYVERIREDFTPSVYDEDLYMSAYMHRLHESFAIQGVSMRCVPAHSGSGITNAHRIESHVACLRMAKERRAVRLAKIAYVELVGGRFDFEYDDSENDRDGYVDDEIPFDEFSDEDGT